MQLWVDSNRMQRLFARQGQYETQTIKLQVFGQFPSVPFSLLNWYLQLKCMVSDT